MAKQIFTVGQVATAAQMNNLQTNDFNQTVNVKTGNYTLAAADAGTRIVMDAAGATTITVNTSLFAAGDTLSIHNIGAGLLTITAGTATVNSAGNTRLRVRQYASGTLYFTSAGVAIWFANASISIASGVGYGGASSTTITFPAGRFTATPDLIITNIDSTVTPLVSTVTSTSFTFVNSVGSNNTFSFIANQGAN